MCYFGVSQNKNQRNNGLVSDIRLFSIHGSNVMSLQEHACDLIAWGPHAFDVMTFMTCIHNEAFHAAFSQGPCVGIYQDRSTFCEICSENHIDGLVQERRNSSALAMELCLSCINPSIWVS